MLESIGSNYTLDSTSSLNRVSQSNQLVGNFDNKDSNIIALKNSNEHTTKKVPNSWDSSNHFSYSINPQTGQTIIQIKDNANKVITQIPAKYQIATRLVIDNYLGLNKNTNQLMNLIA